VPGRAFIPGIVIPRDPVSFLAAFPQACVEHHLLPGYTRRMLRFTVFDEDGPARDWPLVNAHILGVDDTALEGVVTFSKGKIVCKAVDTQPAIALCLEVNAGKAGTMMLQTCLLEQRNEPYRLYEELSRHRVKIFLEKSENWGFLDPAKAPEAFEQFERARSMFVTGTVDHEPYRAQVHHRDALAIAMDASEKLVMKRTEWMLHRRYAKQGAQRALGVRVPVEKAPELLKSALVQDFDILSVPTPWHLIEPTQGRFVWDQVDRWMQFAKAGKRELIVGPLLDASAAGIPGWVRPMMADPAKLKDRLHAFITEVVTRYAPLNPIWNIVSSIHLNEAATLSPEAMVQATRIAAVAVRQVQKNAKLLVEVGDPFGDIPPDASGAMNAIRYLRSLVSEGVTVDIVGIPVVVGDAARGKGTRDLMQIAAMLERFTSRKEMPPVVVTACGAPSEPHPEPGAGFWRRPWGTESQGAWAGMCFQIAMANPGIQAVVWDRLRDDAGVGIKNGGLFATDGSPKSAAERIVRFRRRIRMPLPPLNTDVVRSAAEDS
jgi:GH35 family endo-1,4-beta-xylanase